MVTRRSGDHWTQFFSFARVGTGKERCDGDHATHDDSLVDTGGRGTHLVNTQLPATGKKA
jgi:hypothetical protein